MRQLMRTCFKKNLLLCNSSKLSFVYFIFRYFNYNGPSKIIEILPDIKCIFSNDNSASWTDYIVLPYQQDHLLLIGHHCTFHTMSFTLLMSDWRLGNSNKRFFALCCGDLNC